MMARSRMEMRSGMAVVAVVARSVVSGVRRYGSR